MLSPGIAGVLVAMQWKPGELFMIAAVPTLLASVAILVVHWLVRRRARQTSPAGAQEVEGARHRG